MTKIQPRLSYYMISVWMTCCNRAQYLEDAINSILSQTLMPSEILISNDCSTDGTKEILDRYADEHPDLIKVYHQPVRLGITKNKNFLLRKCKGEYITWLDGDDRFLPQKLEREMDCFHKYPDAKVVVSDCDRIDEYGRFVKPHFRGCLLESCQQPYFGPADIDLYSAALRIQHRGVHCRNELVYRDALEDIGLYDENVVLWQDFDYRIRLFKKFQVIYLPCTTHEWRRYSSQSSQTDEEQSRKDIQYLYDKYNIATESEELQSNWPEWCRK